MKIEPNQEIFIFPLQAVLFPEGLLPLKVFEQRYMEMTKACLRDGQPFGVCLIREGHEVGSAAVPEPVGCLANIVHWEMPQLGVFQLLARGGERFRIREMRVQPNQLIAASTEPLPSDTGRDQVDPACGELLRVIIDKAGAERFPAPLRLDDAAWVGFRLAEMLPMDTADRQQLLELTDAQERLARLKRIMVQQGLASSDQA
ncbi:MAG: LON peptidase substrate-binding domain-containing protein [Betaproteobacteria bacterium]|nr:LON peptidase substrate-binding domain-containing protein [Betaproteobacteria bacterium]